MARFSLHAVAPNRPGIVAAVTQALAAIGCNLQDSRMSLLHGQFSMMLFFEAPGISSGTAIQEALTPLLEELALQMFVRAIPEGVAPPLGNVACISVHGADHPGTVARIARAIASAGGDIVELVGHVDDMESDTPSHLEITVAIPSTAVPGLRENLDTLARELGMRSEVSDSVPRPT